MDKIVVSMRTLGTAVTLAFAAATLPAQQPAPDSPGKTAEQAYKNIQVLQGTPVDQFLPEMRLFGAALGVDCNFCHLEEDRSKDDKESKKTARAMISMVREINKSAFGGQLAVTCYTCHRGNVAPVTVPILPSVEQTQLDEEQKSAALPSADAILSKYIQALGGEQAVHKVTSRMMTATEDLPTGPGGRMTAQAELVRYAKAPNLQLNVYHSDKFTISDGFDGTVAWSQDAKGAVADLTGPDLIRARRGADFYQSANLKQEYDRLAVVGTENVDNRDAYLVVGFPKSGLPERLYFDVQTGLLLRTLSLLPTQLGNSPWQVDYDDYRETGSGVKFPFVIRMIPGTSNAVLARQSTIRVEKIQENVPIDGDKFAKPQSRKPAP